MPKNEMCPFCGGDDIHIDDHAHEEDSLKYIAWCDDCGCSRDGKPTESEAIAAWNKRFVDYDKDGKAVFAGDEVNIIFDDPDIFDEDDDLDATATVRLGGYIDFNEPGFCDTLLSDRDFNAQIELIKKSEAPQ